MTSFRKRIEEYSVLKGVPLKHLGINEYAWKYDDAMVLIDMLKDANIPVLGGDVYTVKDGAIRSTYHSWYVNNPQEIMSESWNRAKEYIKQYESSNRDQSLFVFVCKTGGTGRKGA